MTVATTPVTMTAAEVLVEATRRVTAAADEPGNAHHATELREFAAEFADLDHDGIDAAVPAAMASLMRVTLSEVG